MQNNLELYVLNTLVKVQAKNSLNNLLVAFDTNLMLINDNVDSGSVEPTKSHIHKIVKCLSSE